MSPTPRTWRVVVVGAGITGLTAAFTALDHIAPADAPADHETDHAALDQETDHAALDQAVEVTVLEASARVGGKVATGLFHGHPVDAAADAFLARVPDGIELCRRLGLADQLVAPAARTAYVYRHGDLHPFPEGLVLGVPTDLEALARSGVISPAGVNRAAQDLTMAPEPGVGPGSTPRDESVGSLVRRRLGDEIYEVLVGPLLSGVNAGDADQLSLAAGAPQLAAAVAHHGSLIAGARAQRAAATDPQAPVFFGLPTGTQTLTDVLADRIVAAGGVIRTDTTVEAVARRPDGGFVVSGDGWALEADTVILTTPLPPAARLVGPLAPEVARAMGEVEYASPVMVVMALTRADIDHPLDASGFLVAGGEPLLLSACSWASSKWAHLDDPDVAILRASAGRAHDRRANDLDDAALVDALVEDLGTTMGVHGRPLEVRVTRWDESLPQFRPGHLERVASWRRALAEAAPGLLVAGAGYEGLGLPACIRQGRIAAEQARDLQVLGEAESSPL